ncbi:MAG: tyrosine-protein phosphatase [Acidimicrobiia bacterium]|nr:tyrosine-protein phosphatase [Acidimicrobiia bacterium]
MSSDTLLDLDGPANFRDLGGHVTVDHRALRRGRVFRSDSLSGLSREDVVYLRDTLAIATVIDLRAPHEVQEYGHGPLAPHVRQLHLPIVDSTREPAEPRRVRRKAQEFQTLDQIYLFMLEEYGPRFADVLRVIADTPAQPVVFHCAAGKDRTGLTSALVLGLCSVPNDAIVADFAFTESRMPTIIARHHERAEGTGAAVEVAGQQYGAQALTMRTVLAAIEREHGSVEGYARSIGLESTTIAALRTSLVSDETP